MKFDFSLEPVLEVRKHEEKIQKQKLAEKLSRRKDIASQKERLQQKLKAHIEHSESVEFSNLHDLRRHRSYISELYREMEKLEDSLKVVEKAVSQQRDKLAEVHKERHIMEKIKEEEHQIFMERISREEQKMMDEIATQSYSQ